jgi:hypothetical protein
MVIRSSREIMQEAGSIIHVVDHDVDLARVKQISERGAAS